MSAGKSAALPRACQLRRLEQEGADSPEADEEEAQTSPRTLKSTNEPFWTSHQQIEPEDHLSNDDASIFSLRKLLQAYTAMYEDGSSDWHAFGWGGQELSLFELILDAEQFNTVMRTHFHAFTHCEHC